MEVSDPRDEQIYKVSLLDDGKLWFLENLGYDCAGAKDISQFDELGVSGKLYNWETAKRACPEGWRLPTFKEWRGLIDAYGGLSNAPKRLASVGFDVRNTGTLNSVNSTVSQWSDKASFWTSSKPILFSRGAAHLIFIEGGEHFMDPYMVSPDLARFCCAVRCIKK